MDYIHRKRKKYMKCSAERPSVLIGLFLAYERLRTYNLRKHKKERLSALFFLKYLILQALPRVFQGS